MVAHDLKARSFMNRQCQTIIHFANAVRGSDPTAALRHSNEAVKILVAPFRAE